MPFIDIVIGHKTAAFFDIWTIEHLVTGISIGSVALLHTRKKLLGFVMGYGAEGFESKKTHETVLTRFDLISVLFLAYLWEAFEHYLEAGIAGAAVTNWFQGIEVWHNRLISDPLMLIVGYYLVKRMPRLVWPARIFTAVWLTFHIFIFPHSMYLQDLLWLFFKRG